MALATRRQFVQQTALAPATLCGGPIELLAGAGRIFEAREQGAALLDAAAIQRLASEISGHVITTEAPDYESSRLVFNRAFDQHPALIVRCAGASDVARALDFAQSRNLALAVRGGGHSRAGFSVCEGGMVIDLSGMKRVEVDAGKRVARAEAGSLVRDLDAAKRSVRRSTGNLGKGMLTVYGNNRLEPSLCVYQKQRSCRKARRPPSKLHGAASNGFGIKSNTVPILSEIRSPAARLRF